MISDTPDSHTAALAVQAATKGHLVLAGMHTSSSITAAARLHTGGSEPFLLVTALRAAVGQRLVRKLCPDCRVRVTLSDEQRKELEQSFGIATPAARKRVHELESALAPVIFGDVKQLSSTPQRITHLWGPGSAGCDTCEHSGYQGRTAITEILQSTPRVQKLLLSREIVPAAELQAAAVKDGFIPMALDGLVKALRGQTTIAEVLRSVHSAA
jgi:type IV pilus assembly protein PilB